MLMMYVVCGLTLTAHIAFADHHCLDHCHDEAPAPAPVTLSADGHCDFDHHFVEEHHEEAVNRGTAVKVLSPAEAPLESDFVLIDRHATAVVPVAAPTPRTAHGPPTPARAPPAS
jgi:hypothetical protein